MSLDSFLIKAQAEALNERLAGARIDKIFMPRVGEAVISVRGEMGAERLMVSCGGANSGVYLTSLRPENPPSPPMLCMLLRKHMQGGRIISVTQPEGERMMVITFSSTDELGRMSEKKLVCELMGKRTNLILLDEKDIILGCVKKVDYESSPDRAVLPGLLYHMPPRSGKPSVFGMETEELEALLSDAADAEQLMDRVEGLSPLIARELIFRGLSAGQMADAIHRLAQGQGSPWLVRRGGRDFDISCMDICQYADGESVPYPDFSLLLDDFYRQKRESELKKNLSLSLKKSLDNHRQRLERKLGKQKQELLTARNREKLKRDADLITANIYAIKSGDDKAVVTDYFSEDMATVEIPLDPDMSPQQNAQLLYKRYARLKNAEEALTRQIELGEEELDYIDSLLYSLGQITGEKDLKELTAEAANAGYVKKTQNRKGKPEKPGAIAPVRYVTSNGFTLLRGRNNRENDRLTMKEAKGGDLWFHARNIPGSHVIMVLEGREPEVSDIEEAAALAALYSQSGQSNRVAVDYTRAKQVKKPQGARPGMVNYFNFKTILIEPKEPKRV